MLHVRNFETADDLMAHYKALKSRQKAIIAYKQAPKPQTPVIEEKGHRLYIYPIGPIMSSAQPRESSIEMAYRILREISEYHGLTREALVGNCRTQRFVRARQHLFWRLRNETGWSTPRIGQFAGGKDHTTVLHGVRRHQERLIRTAREGRT